MAGIQYPNPFFDPGTFNATVVDNNGQPSTVLDAGQPFTIRTQTDLGAVAALFLGGTLQYAAYAESIGPGVEKQIGQTVNFAMNGTQVINTDIVVTPGALGLPNNLGPGQSGAYKLVVLLTHRSVNNSVTDVAAVVDGPVLRIS